MEIFNIHLFEFLLIASLALVVFGPERLPEVGRFVGKQVARFLAWQQQSPELKMINEIRSEFEGEIASLRDELVRTRQQLDVRKEVNNLRSELRPMLDLRTDVQAASTTATPVTPAVTPDPVAPAPAPTPTSAAQSVPSAARPNRLAAVKPTNLLGPPSLPVADPAPQDAPRRQTDPAEQTGDLQTILAQPTSAPATTPAEETRALLDQIQTLMADMQALVLELQSRNLLGPDWQPPSQARTQETVSQ